MKKNRAFEGLSEYFKDRILQKIIAFVMLLFFNFNIFADIVPDPVSIGTRVTKTASGVDQIDIAAPNKNGTSYNSLKELQVSEQGLILNNNKNVVINTQIAGLVVRNRNLDNGIEANLIITEVTGKNKTNINGIVEVAGKRADLVMANRNGIFVNGGGFLNSDRVTLTTGSLQMKDGDLVAIDVSQGHIGVGEKGIDALSLTDLELLGKTIDIAGVIKASKETRVMVSAGGQTYQYKTKEVKSKGETYSGIAVDGKAAGSMYAGKIDIISNDKGAGVNTKGDLVSVDDVILTANGDITTNKVNAGKKVVYKTPKKVRIKGETTSGKKVQIKAKETEIDAKVITGYLEEALGEKAFEIESDKTKITSKIEVQGKVDIKSKETENKGEVFATEKINITGQKLDNSNGEIRSNRKIELDVTNTVNKKGYILSDGLTKEEAKQEEESKQEDNKKADTETEKGINITGSVDNTEGLIKGREVRIGGNLTGNAKGKVESIGALTLDGKVIDNKNGTLKGNIKEIDANKFINDEGKILTNEKLDIAAKEGSNIRGEIFGSEGVKIVGEKLNNLTGVIRSNGKIDLNVKETINREGYILSDGITKEEAKKWEVKEKGPEKKEDKKEESKKDEVKEQTTGVELKADRLDNTKGIIASLGQTTLNVGKVSNVEGKIVSRGVVELTTPNEYEYEGLVEGDAVTTLNGKKITIKEKMERKNTLELIGQEGIILKDEIVSGILRLDTKSDLKNAKDIRGLDTLSVTAKNIENEGNLLSDKNLYVKAEGKLLNKGTGLIKGKENTYLEGNIIENNRGKILSEGSLTLIAETLIRNDTGKIDAKGDIYGEVKNGHFENVGTTEVEIKDVLKATGTEGAAVGGIFSRLRRKSRPQTVKQEKERTYRIDMDDSNITSEGSIYIKAENGDVINKDGGNIEGKKGVRIDAKNVYNTGRYI